MTGRRHNATGRSISRFRREKDQAKFVPEGPYMPMEGELLASPAWRSLTIAARALIDRIIVEHVAHKRLENDRLPITFDQFEEYGVYRKSIVEAVSVAESLGLIRMTMKGQKRYGDCPGRASTFGLTFAPVVRNDGSVQEATNEWRKIETIEDATDIVNAARKACAETRPKRAQKRNSPGGENATVTVAKTPLRAGG